MLSIDDLRQVTFSITRKCNLTCDWCFNDAGKRYEDVLDTETLVRILESISPYAEGITFTGGEPFLVRDIGDLIQKAIYLDFKEISITTNGVAIPRKYEPLLQHKRIALAISIDGDEPRHDSNRGAGTFARTKKRIEELVEAGINVALFMTVSKRNLDCVPALLDLANELGVIGVSFQRLRCIGRGRNFNEEALSNVELKTLASYIQSAQEKITKYFVNFKDPMRNLLNEEFVAVYKDLPQNYICGGCQAGISYLYITEEGIVQPCAFLNIPLGHMLKDDLVDIWEHSEVLNSLRNKNRYKVCNLCTYWHMCRGCRADAYNTTGDYMAGDPSCWTNR